MVGWQARDRHLVRVAAKLPAAGDRHVQGQQQLHRSQDGQHADARRYDDGPWPWLGGRALQLRPPEDGTRPQGMLMLVILLAASRLASRVCSSRSTGPGFSAF